MMQPLGTRLSMQETKKLHSSTFSLFQPSSVGNRRSDARMLNLMGGIYVFAFFIFIFSIFI